MPNTEVMIKPKLDLDEPSKFKVIYVNDSKTTMQFVINSAIEYFDYNVKDAEQLAHDIHNKGSAVAAVMWFQLAEQKGIEVTLAARAAGFPLQIKIEKEYT